MDVRQDMSLTDQRARWSSTLFINVKTAHLKKITLIAFNFIIYKNIIMMFFICLFMSDFLDHIKTISYQITWVIKVGIV